MSRVLPLAASLVLSALVGSVPARAQVGEFAYAQPYFEMVADDDAIPGGIVSVLAQDERGLLWIGTRRGLVRWDGYQFHTFAHARGDAASLAGDVISALALARDGKLWVGTRSDGVSVRAPGAEGFTHIRRRDGDARSLVSDEVRALVADRDGTMWIGTEEGLAHFDPVAGTFTNYRHAREDDGSLASDHVLSLLLDRRGDLWIGTSAGLDRLRHGAATFEHIAADADDPASLRGDTVVALLEAGDGRIWVGTGDRGAAWLRPDDGVLHRLEVDAERPNRLSHGRVSRIVQPRSDEIWIGTMGGGINVVDASTGAVVRRIRHEPTVHGALALDQVGDFLLDRSGLLWVGSWGGGLQRYQPQQNAFRTLRADMRHDVLSDSNVSSVLETRDGRLWVGTRSRGVDIFSRTAGKVAHLAPAPGAPDALGDGAVYAMAQTPDGSVWLGTQLAGVFRTAPDRVALRRYGAAEGLVRNSVVGLTVAADGGLWIASNGGLARWDPATDRIGGLTHDDGRPFDAQVTQVLEDRDGRLWVGGASGLYLRTAGTAGLRRILPSPNTPGGLVHDDVRGMLLDRQGTLWLATAQGLARLRGWQGDAPRFDDVSAMLGAPGLHVGGNLLDDEQGRLWTQWYVIEPGKRRLYRLSRADGVDIGTAWNGSYARTHDGLLLYGGAQGLLVVDPRRFEPWHYAPPIVATHVRVNGRPQAVGLLDAGLELAPDQRSFAVEFAALDFSAPQRLLYQYRLHGFDHEWIATDAEHRVAGYTNLAPGDYTLTIRGSNRLGNWSPHELTVPVRVLPAFWQTAWFRVAVALAAIALVVALFRWRVRHLSRSEQRLREQVNARTGMLRQQAERLQAADEEKSALLAKLQQQAIALERQAREDPLTGLYNRRAFDESLALAFSRARHERRPLAVAIIDVDHFKRVNDVHAHAAGDAALRLVARVLREEAPASATVARYGGEEFALLFPDTPLGQARVACEEIRVAIAEADFGMLAPGLRITVSIGLTGDTNVAHAEKMISAADDALYQAKRGGRDRVCC